VTFSDLTGWQADDLLDLLPMAGFQDRADIETRLSPQLVSAKVLFTGYYEPELDASPVETPQFAFPIYAPPTDLTLTRADIDNGALSGQGLELAWLADPVDRFFLQVQGSGRLRMPDGDVCRVGFAAKTLHAYSSIGKVAIELGAFTPQTITADALKDWLRAQPDQGKAAMQTNKAYVFFRLLPNLHLDEGPIGTLGQPLKPMRSLAVDEAHVPLGSLVWVETEQVQRLMIAQDTGSAIKGLDRADIFVGTGFDAGRLAGAMKQSGRLFVLTKRDSR
jgi:membrane-bound lytic murein transglycosylase A